MAKYRTQVQRGWTFANVRLSSEQRDAFIGWATEMADDWVEILVTILLEGYKLGARFDDENQTWITTLTGLEDNPVNGNTSMSARHSDFETALSLLCFKHKVVSEGLSWSEASESEDWG